MQEFNIEETTGYILAQICKNHKSRANEKLMEIGLYAAQEMVLMYLNDHPSIILTSLADAMQVKPSTISKVTKGLSKEGFISLDKDERDKRIVKISLTKKGTSILSDITRIWNELEDMMLETFSVEEKIIIRRLMIQMLRNLQHGEST